MKSVSGCFKRELSSIACLLSLLIVSCLLASPAEASVTAMIEGLWENNGISRLSDADNEVSLSYLGNNTGLNGEATASINANTGTMSVYAKSFFDYRGQASRVLLGDDWMNPAFHSFTIHGLTDNSPVTIKAQLHLTGSLNASGVGRKARLITSLASNSSFGVAPIDSFDQENEQQGLVMINKYLTNSIYVSADHPDFKIQYTMLASTWHKNTEALGNAQLSFILPEGTYITSSDSGYNSSSPVPLPATAWLFAPGLFGLLGFKRKLEK